MAGKMQGKFDGLVDPGGACQEVKGKFDGLVSPGGAYWDGREGSGNQGKFDGLVGPGGASREVKGKFDGLVLLLLLSCCCCCCCGCCCCCCSWSQVRFPDAGLVTEAARSGSSPTQAQAKQPASQVRTPNAGECAARPRQFQRVCQASSFTLQSGMSMLPPSEISSPPRRLSQLRAPQTSADKCAAGSAWKRSSVGTGSCE